MLKDALVGQERRKAAGLIHEYLRLSLSEPDEVNTDAAAVLLDLYDCHTCAGHVMQVYCKGIMEAASEGVFGMRQLVTMEEAALYETRTLDATKRIPPKTPVRPVPFMSLERALTLKRAGRLILIDVRPQEAFSENSQEIPAELPDIPADTIRIPLSSVLDGSFMGKLPADLPEMPPKSLCFFCEEGYLSLVAGNAAREQGFENCYYTKLSKI